MPGRARQSYGMHPRLRLWAEFVLLFAGLPLLFFWEPLPLPKLPALLAVAAFCWIWLVRDMGRGRFGPLESANGGYGISGLRPVLLGAFGVALLCLVLADLLLEHDQLFAFPRRNPLVFLMVCLLYPLLSALPQEIIYRSFFFRRYGSLFGQGWGMSLASAAAFAFLHIIYDNSISVALSFGAGLIFARTYARTRSLPLVSLEHALYGICAFAVGLGRFFYEGPR